MNPPLFHVSSPFSCLLPFLHVSSCSILDVIYKSNTFSVTGTTSKWNFNLPPPLFILKSSSTNTSWSTFVSVYLKLSPFFFLPQYPAQEECHATDSFSSLLQFYPPLLFPKDWFRCKCKDRLLNKKVFLRNFISHLMVFLTMFFAIFIHKRHTIRETRTVTFAKTKIAFSSNSDAESVG